MEGVKAMGDKSFAYGDSVVQRGCDAASYTGAVYALGTADAVLHEAAFGRLSPEEDAPKTNLQTRFDLASMTKPIAIGMTVLRAMDRGELCLWDKLGHFLPMPEDKAEISVRQLLTHTSGFLPGIHLWKTCANPSEALAALANTPLAFAPGEKMQYCCAGYILLGFLLEKLYGMPLKAIVEKEVLEPLGLSHTGFLPRGGNIAATERQKDGTFLCGQVHDENARFLGGAAGNAGLFSTVGDLSAFARMLLREGVLPDGNRYLSRAAVDLCFRSLTPAYAQDRSLCFYMPHRDFGYTGEYFSPQSIGHTGFTGTSLSIDPERGLFLILLTNRVCPLRTDLSIYSVRRRLHNAVIAALD